MIKVALATFALTYMLRNLDGPWSIFLRLKYALGYEFEMVHINNDEVMIEHVPDRFIPQLFSCHWCLGTWIALMMLICNVYIPVIVAWFAIVGIVGVLYEVVRSWQE